MMRELIQMAVLAVMLLGFLYVIWLGVKNTGKRILQVHKGNRVKGIMLVVITAVGWLLVVVLCQIFIYIAGSIIISNIARYIPSDPPKWEELTIAKRFPMLNEVKVLKSGDPGDHKFNQKVCDYLIYLADPADAAALRHSAGEVIERYKHTGDISAYWPYVKGYEQFFPECKERCVIWHDGGMEYDVSLYEGQEGYFYIRVIYNQRNAPESGDAPCTMENKGAALPRVDDTLRDCLRGKSGVSNG